MNSSLVISVLVLLMMGTTCPLFGQETNALPLAVSVVSTVAGPKIQFETPAYDFGKVTVGEPVKCEYVFTNTGDAVLVISNVQPSCGCTTAGTWTRQTDPWKTGVVPVQFNTSAYSGQVEKSIKVFSNDKSHPIVELQLNGTVWRPIEVTPRNAIFNLPPDLTSNSTTVLNIHNNTDQPITLSDPELNVTNFTADIKIIQPGKDFQLNVRAVPPLGTGHLQGQVTIRTSSTNMPVLTVMALAIIQPAAGSKPAK